MNRIFSVDDLLEPFWQTNSTTTTSSSMNRSASEWEFQSYLQQDFPPPQQEGPVSSPALTSSQNPDDRSSHPNPPPPHQPLDRSSPVDDPEEYRALLKSKLHLACAAAAKSMASSVKPEGGCGSLSSSSVIIDDQGAAAAAFVGVSGSTQLVGSHADFGAGHCKSGAQHDANIASANIPALPAMQKKQEVQVRQTTSGSSREDSDDDELEGDTGTNENSDPADVKRARRMQSNRESARRSRRRKQEQLNDLESQVDQLRDERTSLLTRFMDINHKCDEAAIGNRILKAEIETLRAKVKMAEEQVKRVTGLNPMLLPRSNMPSMGSQFVRGQVDAPSNFAVPMPPNSNQLFHQPVPSFNTTSPHLQTDNSFSNGSLAPHASNGQTDNGNNAHGLPPVQLTAGGQNMVDTPSRQHVQKQIASAVTPGGTLPVPDLGMPCTLTNDIKK